MSSTASSVPTLLCGKGSRTTRLTDAELRQEIYTALTALGPREDVLLLPPDFTRFHSQAGKITQMICQFYNFIPTVALSNEDDASTASVSGSGGSGPNSSSSSCSPTIQILPALGTHAPMTETQLRTMYGDALTDMQPSPFVVHDWRHDVVTLGHVPATMVERATDGKVKGQTWPAQLNRLVWSKRRAEELSGDEGTIVNKTAAVPPLVLSIGQVVPHEVMGMANYNKNLFVGTGGVAAINLSHFIGAVHGMERMMGQTHNPLRDILQYASEQFLERQMDLWYFLTVVGTDSAATTTVAATTKVERPLALRGLFIGRNIECYEKACALSLQVNFTLVSHPVQRCVVFLDADEFHSTWLGNKAIYRTRMAMADGGTLIILAPGVSRFGEDKVVDGLIRSYGYRGTNKTLEMMDNDPALQENLSAVAHLIHGSTEGRFEVVYCPGQLTRDEIENEAGFLFGDLKSMMERYDPSQCLDGWNKDVDGQDFFYISNPALGLWAVESRFEKERERG